MGCFWSRRTYETQVEPVDPKSDLIGRPLHQVAAVQKQFGYENSSATKWKRQKGLDTSWDSRAKDEQRRQKKSIMANVGRSASSYNLETPRSSQNSKDGGPCGTASAPTVSGFTREDDGDLIGQPIHDRALLRSVESSPGVFRRANSTIDDTGSTRKKKRSLKKMG